MTIQLKEFLDAKRLPAFLSQNKILLSFDKVDKIFPKIGLTNSDKECILDNSKFVAASALTFLQAVQYIFDHPSKVLCDYYKWMPAKDFTADKNAEIYSLGFVINETKNQIIEGYNKCIINDNGKLSLKIYEDVSDNNNRVVFKSGESIFKIYTKIYKSLMDLKCGVTVEKLDTMPEFKRFSSDNLPQDKFKIVFSSDGIDGLWDIATMSMRGISSCQSWDGQYKNNLVGSIVDPFAAVIYITSGTKMNNLGSKMVKRSIVRFVIQKNKPTILIDKMYPEHDPDVLNKFVSFIQEKVDGKFPVVFGPDYGDPNIFYIPSSPVHSKLTTATISYRDTKVPFKFENSQSSTFEKNLKAKKTKFVSLLKNSAFKYLADEKRTTDPCYQKIKFKNKETQNSIIKICATPDFNFLIRDFYADIALFAINSFDNKNILTSNEYSRKLYFYYMNNKKICFKAARAACLKKINDYWKLELNSSTLEKILKSTQANVDDAVKLELKKLIKGKQSSKSKTSN